MGLLSNTQTLELSCSPDRSADPSNLSRTLPNSMAPAEIGSDACSDAVLIECAQQDAMTLLANCCMAYSRQSVLGALISIIDAPAHKLVPHPRSSARQVKIHAERAGGERCERLLSALADQACSVRRRRRLTDKRHDIRRRASRFDKCFATFEGRREYPKAFGEDPKVFEEEDAPKEFDDDLTELEEWAAKEAAWCADALRLAESSARQQRRYARKGFRVPRALVSPSLLRAPVPSDAVLEAAKLALSAGRDEDSQEEEEHEDPEVAMIREFEDLRRKFCKQHRQAVDDAGLGMLSKAPIHRDVMERFLKAFKTFGKETLVLAYHGTPAHNLPSIFRSGFVVPGRGNKVRVANGSAHGLGIYVAEEGAESLSRGFLKGSNKMLVCGVIDTTRLEQQEMEERMRNEFDERRPEAQTTRRRPTFARRGGQLAHRRSSKPAAALARLQAAKVAGAQQRARYMGRFVLGAQNQHLRHAGTAMVVFREENVAPLYVADPMGPAEDKDTFRQVVPYDVKALLHPLRNRPERAPRIGRRRAWDSTDERSVWLPGEAHTARQAVELKRRLVRRTRNADRSWNREEKELVMTLW
mmetsp:Transcript_72883/g.209202  ORF Transcript_72883/g.209202 Transcript_72883/m.209202 type:complete len:585 (+) Transcript_72883:2-1756(+)